MDKFEYNVRANEIKELIKEREYVKAAKIADSIDWRRVKSTMMLCTVSDVYKINRRYVESRDVLTYAYERNPQGRLILYYLCELSIKLGDIVSAMEYYKRFAVLAPTDAGQFILLYKIYEAQDVTLEERISVLEELKRREYKEKWAFELAYLYHLIGETSLCIEECDEIFLWFGKGKYVTKALELKQLHVELSDEQLARLNEPPQVNTYYEPDSVDGVDYYDEKEEDESENDSIEDVFRVFSNKPNQKAKPEEPDYSTDFNLTAKTKEIDIKIKPVDVSQYNTINLQQEIAENMREILGEDEPAAFRPMKDILTEAETYNEETEQSLGGNTEEIYFSDTDTSIDQISQSSEEDDAYQQINLNLQTRVKKGMTETGIIKAFNKNSSFDEILSQEYDGQISLVVPEEKKVEKQITGQLKIDDILTEWERQKKEIEEKRKAEVRKKIQAQSNRLFDDFDEKTKMGLLEKLEKAMVDAVAKAGPSVIKVADIGTELKQIEPAGEDEAKTYDDTEVLRILAEPDIDLSVIQEDLDNEETIPDDESITANDTADTIKDTEELIEAEINTAPPEEEIAKKEETEEANETSPEKADEVEIPDPDKSAADVVRELSTDEKTRFGRFVKHKKTRRQLVNIVDSIGNLSPVNHIIITGEESLANMRVVKGLIKEAKDKSNDYHGKVIKVTADTLNKKDVSATFANLKNGIIIIEQAAGLKKETLNLLLNLVDNPENKLMLFIEDNRTAIDEMLAKNSDLNKEFPYRIDLNALDNQSLVEYAKNYAFEQEYSIDEFGILALHTRIAELQTSDHEVTTAEVEELIEEAIYYADRKNPKHFFDILAGKRYDEEDMIVLREKDFLH
ncbi:MAG: hypothetical protein FWC09_01820 [Lachnospiraceae bacterium]|nr:hypothetical protein [Lachnospiraceae bacterium]